MNGYFLTLSVNFISFLNQQISMYLKLFNKKNNLMSA
jgi:hypothetical protein